MAFDYTTTGLISNIQQRILVPNSQNLWDNDNILVALNDQFQSDIVPFIIKAKTDFYLTSVVYPINQSSNIIEGSTSAMYAIPQTAIGQKVAELVFYDSSTGLTRNMPQLDIDKISNYFGPTGYQNVGFYIQDNSVVLFPARGMQGNLKLYYYQRPNELILTSDAGQITSVNGTTNAITLSNVPTEWTAGTTTLDIQNQYQPWNIELTNQTIVNISNPTVTLTSVSGIKVGDWVCASGYAVIPTLPQELWRLLAQNVAVKILESLGDPTIEVTKQQYNEMLNNLQSLISTRVDREPVIITSAGGSLFDSMYSSQNWYRPI
jgi:hypothetical protein